MKIDSNRYRHIIHQRPSVSILKNMLVGNVIPEIRKNMCVIQHLEEDNVLVSKYRYESKVSTYEILEDISDDDEPRKFCMILGRCLDELDSQHNYIHRLNMMR